MKRNTVPPRSFLPCRRTMTNARSDVADSAVRTSRPADAASAGRPAATRATPTSREVRARLLRMIVANEWDRSHGNRAS